VLRDSAYKIKKLAVDEREAHIRKGWWHPMPAGAAEGVSGTVNPARNGSETARSPGTHGAIAGKQRKEKEEAMAERLEVYKCEACGNIIEVLHGGEGELVCCGEPMKKMTENTVDAAKEKHVPVIEKISGGYKVKVGEVAHPMEEKHYIEWIELIADGKAYRQFLEPGQAPEADFMIAADQVSAREYCNIHGLWKA
jgi:superoxide reductase